MDGWEEWQKEYRFGTFVIWPPDRVRTMVNAQREMYDPVSQSYCQAHITITQPAIAKLTHSDWEQIEKILREIDPFEISYGPLKSFLPYPCIWYAIEPHEVLLHMHTKLASTGLFKPSPRPDRDFIPHLTITEGLSGPEVNTQLLEKLRAESENGSFHCDSLAYIVADEDFCFHVTRELRLGQV